MEKDPKERGSGGKTIFAACVMVLCCALPFPAAPDDVEAVMVERSRQERDWVGNYRAFAIAWGLPIAALIAAIFVGTLAKTIIWIAALVWMGIACLANATRCGRRHCYFTGPFFLVMAVVSGLHGFGFVPLGPEGWSWLGITIGAGGGLLWFIPEQIWGSFAARRQT